MCCDKCRLEVRISTWRKQMNGLGKGCQWQQYGYGPWAFEIDQQFAGWGGLQYEEGDADLALVLHPKFWGSGKEVLQWC